ncbi:MAG: HelD family protein [Acidimicrobiales bacterium]
MNEHPRDAAPVAEGPSLAAQSHRPPLEPCAVGGIEAEIAIEQQAVDRAYHQLISMRQSAIDVVRHHHDLSRSTTGQARVEWESLLALTDQRLHHLELGGASLCFGRLNLQDGETYQVGRLSVLDDAGDPLVVDWRAPAAEPFYRATGLDPMGLIRRRHLLTRGRRVVGVDDEVFDLGRAADGSLSVVGEGALLAALERSRSGRMGDIVATIQAEQDVIIRAPIPGILIVQGGPGTGKTAVALHRAAYLLYTNRQRLEDAGVLVIGPNRTFLRYIEQVLPSLGESGVELLTIDGVADRVRSVAPESPAAERLKGERRMVGVIAKAVRTRQRPLPGELVVPYGARNLRLPRAELARLVEGVASRSGTHNAHRRTFANRLRRALWRQQRRLIEQRLAGLTGGAGAGAGIVDPEDLLDGAESAAAAMERAERNFLETIGQVPEVRAALERMWPVLTPEDLLNDLFGSPGLLRLATAGVLTENERELLARPRARPLSAARWTSADLALLDEAAVLLGPLPSSRRRRGPLREDLRWAMEDTVGDIALQTGELDHTMRRQLIDRLATREAVANQEDEDDGTPAVYGHVIVDEAQDLSPMQWRMVARRCTIGSMTIVGDLGQASRPGSIRAWDQALSELPVRREPRTAELTVNYRTPAEIMDLAARVLAVTDPGVEPPRSVRRSGTDPRLVTSTAQQLVADTITLVTRMGRELGEGKIAVIAPRRLVAPIRGALQPELLEAGEHDHGDVLSARVGVFSAVEAKGLEFDAVVLVEPAEVAAANASEIETQAGLRGLYVALTRATRFLTIVHAEPLPPGLAPLG